VGDRGPFWTAPVARLARRSALMALALAFVAPATAYAHTGGRIASDFEARIVGLRPRASGVRARVLGGDLKPPCGRSPMLRPPRRRRAGS
jgi:hypothetical protein